MGSQGQYSFPTPAQRQSHPPSRMNIGTHREEGHQDAIADYSEPLSSNKSCQEDSARSSAYYQPHYSPISRYVDANHDLIYPWFPIKQANICDQTPSSRDVRGRHLSAISEEFSAGGNEYSNIDDKLASSHSSSFSQACVTDPGIHHGNSIAGRRNQNSKAAEYSQSDSHSGHQSSLLPSPIFVANAENEAFAASRYHNYNDTFQDPDSEDGFYENESIARNNHDGSYPHDMDDFNLGSRQHLAATMSPSTWAYTTHGTIPSNWQSVNANSALDNHQPAQPTVAQQHYQHSASANSIFGEQAKHKADIKANKDREKAWQDEDGLWWHQVNDNERPVLAVRHYEIANLLRDIANRRGTYNQEVEKGRSPDDRLAFVPAHADWGGDWPNRPNVLFQFRKPKPCPAACQPRRWVFEGRRVINWNNKWMWDYDDIPVTIPSTVAGWRMEAYMRRNPSLSLEDIQGRMPENFEAKIKGKEGDHDTWYNTTLRNRTMRFRDKALLMAWTRKDSCEETLTYLEEKLDAADELNNSAQGWRDLNSTRVFGRDLNKDELREFEKLRKAVRAAKRQTRAEAKGDKGKTEQKMAPQSSSSSPYASPPGSYGPEISNPGPEYDETGHGSDQDLKLNRPATCYPPDQMSRRWLQSSESTTADVPITPSDRQPQYDTFDGLSAKPARGTKFGSSIPLHKPFTSPHALLHNNPEQSDVVDRADPGFGSSVRKRSHSPRDYEEELKNHDHISKRPKLHHKGQPGTLVASAQPVNRTESAAELRQRALGLTGSTDRITHPFSTTNSKTRAPSVGRNFESRFTGAAGAHKFRHQNASALSVPQVPQHEENPGEDISVKIDPFRLGREPHQSSLQHLDGRKRGFYSPSGPDGEDAQQTPSKRQRYDEMQPPPISASHQLAGSAAQIQKARQTSAARNASALRRKAAHHKLLAQNRKPSSPHTPSQRSRVANQGGQPGPRHIIIHNPVNRKLGLEEVLYSHPVGAQICVLSPYDDSAFITTVLPHGSPFLPIERTVLEAGIHYLRNPANNESNSEGEGQSEILTARSPNPLSRSAEVNAVHLRANKTPEDAASAAGVPRITHSRPIADPESASENEQPVKSQSVGNHTRPTQPTAPSHPPSTQSAATQPTVKNPANINQDNPNLNSAQATPQNTGSADQGTHPAQGSPNPSSQGDVTANNVQTGSHDKEYDGRHCFPQFDTWGSDYDTEGYESSSEWTETMEPVGDSIDTSMFPSNTNNSDSSQLAGHAQVSNMLGSQNTTFPYDVESDISGDEHEFFAQDHWMSEMRERYRAKPRIGMHGSMFP